MKQKKCKGCKEYFDADSFEVNRPWNNFHTVKCLQAWMRKKEEEKRKKEYFKHLIDRKPKKQSELTKARIDARKACHAYIRERDKGLPCICCGKPITDQVHAGHFIPAGKSSYLKFNEDNIHAQSLRCNYFHHGDSGYYRVNLIKKIGVERVLWLERNQNNPIKRTASDYRELADYYKQKLRKLKL